eukprot:TRINITY_DN8737_c1_g2_i1.p1 TRINITY_DN8737_c1_g2~~TRINITY_DN8737_c1_g2_i1.p1  ORF type:complete len:242 (+),score=30.92 TRINITY_DN8737_c1_g2_i1:98-823(+)
MKMEVCKEKWRNGTWESSKDDDDDERIPTPPHKKKMDGIQYSPARASMLPFKNSCSMPERKKKGRYARVGICSQDPPSLESSLGIHRPPWGWCSTGCGDIEAVKREQTAKPAPEELPLIHKIKKNPALGERSTVSEDFSMVSSYVSPRGKSQWKTVYDSSGRLVNVLNRKRNRQSSGSVPGTVKTLSDLIAASTPSGASSPTGTPPLPFPLNNPGPQVPKPRGLKRVKGYNHHGHIFYEDA